MGEFLAAVLIFGGFWFWTLCAFAFFVIMAFSENEKNFLAFVTLGLFVVVMESAGATNVLNMITSDPLYMVKWAAIYFVAGSVWSIVKWFSYVRNKADHFGELKLTYITKINSIGKERDGDEWEEIICEKSTKIPKIAADDFIEYLRRNGYMNYSDENVLPSASSIKDRLVSWIIWWPTSALWTLINDPIRKLAEKLYNGMQGIYSRISQYAFKDFNA